MMKLMKEEEGVKNIIFIAVDALRARNLSCYGYPMTTSPNIDNLAKNGILFEDAYCCINATDPSFTTIFSGKYPASHGIINHASMVQEKEIQEFNKRGTVLLPEMLKSRGYTTIAIDWLGRWHRKGYTQYGVINRKYPDLLFSLLRKRQSSKIRKPTEDAKIISDQAINIIRKYHKEKIFLFIHYWDVHTCYNSPKKYVKRYLETKDNENQSIDEMLNQLGNSEWRNYIRYCVKGAKRTNEIIARYDGAIAFADHEIGRLIEALEENKILDQTLIIVTADHGESLTEHGIYFSHHGLYDETIHVPLIFKIPGLPKNKRIKGLVQHTDIVPTILDFLGIDMKNIDFDGKSLIPLIYDEAKQIRQQVYVEEVHTERKRAIRTGEYKYIYALSEKDAICKWCERIHGGVEELYDLKRDPQESKNIVKEKPDIANVLKKQLADYIKYLECKKEKEGVKKKIKRVKNLGKI